MIPLSNVLRFSSNQIQELQCIAEIKKLTLLIPPSENSSILDFISASSM